MIVAVQRVLRRLRCSLPQYLVASGVCERVNGKPLAHVLTDIVADQNQLVQRLAAHLETLGALPVSRTFPMGFTDTHDLAMDYLLQRAIEDQRAALRSLQIASGELATAAATKSLIDEALGMTQAHVELLEECQADVTARSV